MKTYFRILSFAKPFGFLPVFILSVVGYTIFESLNLGSIAPVLNVLFLQEEVVEKVAQPEFSISVEYFKAFFVWVNYYLTNELDKKTALVYLAVLVISSNLLTNFFRFFSRFILAYVKARMIKSIRIAVFQKINQLNISYFSNEKRGDLISRMTNDIQEVEGSIIATLNGMVTEPFKIVFTFTLLFMINSKLMFFSLLVLPVSGAIIGVITGKLRKKAKQGQSYLGQILSTIDETLTGIKIIKSFNAEKIMLDKFRHQNEKYERSLRSMDIKKGLASPLSQFLGISVFCIILFYGGSLVFENQMLPGTFIAFLLLFANVVSPLKAFYTNITNVQRGLIAGGRILNILDQEIQVKEAENSIKIDAFNSEIEFKNVKFNYDEKAILKNINLKIQKGRTIALVGPSGGGKSTLVDLIPRFHDVKEGEILLDGHNLKNIENLSLRSLIGLVTQESILFNDTIYNNIAFGSPHATQQQVEEAAKIANAHDFIVATEAGYNTEIGDRGVKLSGGQKQRLSIARAVLKNPPIMILDEATSALDTESELLVQEALEKLMENRTSIVIAHRLSTIQKADEIIVIKNGEIIERGTHKSLINDDGLYASLTKSQAL